jgi:hypothetical protein
MTDGRERLPPPPFWRTRYYERSALRPDRRAITPEMVLRVVAEPLRRERQPDGRVRLWGKAGESGKWLRVILEPDGTTVHNAFFDRTFAP